MRRPTFVAVVLGIAVSVAVSACGSGGTPQSANGSSASNCAVKASSGLVSDGKLTFGTSLTLAPQDFQAAGKPTGSDIEIAQAIASQMCLEAQFTNSDFQGILPSLDAKKVDAAIATFGITPARKNVFDFVPYFIGGQAMLTKKGSGLKVDGIEGVCGHKFAVLSGSVELANLNTAAPKCPSGNTLNYSVYPSMPEIVQQLVKGTQELAYIDWTVAAYSVKQLPNELELASQIFSGQGQQTPPNIEGIALRKGDTAMQQPISDAFAKVVASGAYETILKKYGLERGDIRKATK